MADPFSITLGVVALAEVTVKCGSGLVSLISQYRHCPDELVALSNEVQDLQLVLSQIESTTCGSLPATTQAVVAPLIKSSRKTLKQLWELVRYFEEKGKTKGQVSLFKAWKKKAKVVAEWKDRILKLKRGIGGILLAEGVASSRRIETTLNQLSIDMQTDRSQFLIASQQCQDLIMKHGSEHTTRLSLIQDSTDTLVQGQSSLVQGQSTLVLGQNNMEEKQAQLLSMMKALLSRTTLPRDASYQASSSTTYSAKSVSTATSSITTLEVSKKVLSGCTALCVCACHRPVTRTLGSSKILKTFLGSLNLGYSGTIVPWVEPCNLKPGVCKRKHRSDITLTYFFPSWWTNKALVGCFSPYSPQLQIVVRNRFTDYQRLDFVERYQTRHDSKEFSMVPSIFDVMGHGDQVMDLFRKRIISPFDTVDTMVEGSSCFIYCAFSRFRKRYRNTGYDPLNSSSDANFIASIMSLVPALDTVDANGFSVASNIGELLLYQEADLTSKMPIDPEFFSYYSIFDNMELTVAHKAILGLSESPLEAILSGNPKLANCEDVFGRTPLHWSAKLGCFEYIPSLLHAGAEANAVDKDGRAPIHELCMLPHDTRDGKFNGEALLSAIKALCDAGADIKSADKDRFCPLHYVLSGLTYKIYDPVRRVDLKDALNVIETLCNAGADPNAVDPDGSSMIACALSRFYGNPETYDTDGVVPKIIGKLLDLGADINLKDSNGRVILVEKTRCELEFFVYLISRGLSYQEKTSAGETVLFRLVNEDIVPWGNARRLKGILDSLRKSSFVQTDTRHRRKDGRDIRELIDVLIEGNNRSYARGYTRELDEYRHQMLSFFEWVDETREAYLSTYHHSELARRITRSNYLPLVNSIHVFYIAAFLCVFFSWFVYSSCALSPSA